MRDKVIFLQPKYETVWLKACFYQVKLYTPSSSAGYTKSGSDLALLMLLLYSPVKMIVFEEEFPHSSIKWTTSPILNEGCPVNTTHGDLKSSLKPSTKKKKYLKTCREKRLRMIWKQGMYQTTTLPNREENTGTKAV